MESILDALWIFLLFILGVVVLMCILTFVRLISDCLKLAKDNSKKPEKPFNIALKLVCIIEAMRIFIVSRGYWGKVLNFEDIVPIFSNISSSEHTVLCTTYIPSERSPELQAMFLAEYKEETKRVLTSIYYENISDITPNITLYYEDIKSGLTSENSKSANLTTLICMISKYIKDNFINNSPGGTKILVEPIDEADSAGYCSYICKMTEKFGYCNGIEKLFIGEYIDDDWINKISPLLRRNGGARLEKGGYYIREYDKDRYWPDNYGTPIDYVEVSDKILKTANEYVYKYKVTVTKSTGLETLLY